MCVREIECVREYVRCQQLLILKRRSRQPGNYSQAMLYALKSHEISCQDIRSTFIGAVNENVAKNKPCGQRPHSENNMTKGFAFRPRQCFPIIGAGSKQIRQRAESNTAGEVPDSPWGESTTNVGAKFERI